jgi:hypothetical protein
MIEPYATVLRDLHAQWSALGLAATKDSDYGVSYSNGAYSVDVATERYYHPSVLMSLRNPQGRRFELGILMDIIAPERSQPRSQILKSIREKYGLDSATTDKAVREQGVAEYARTLIKLILDFMLDFRATLFVSPGSYEAEYAAREKVLMANLK